MINAPVPIVQDSQLYQLIAILLQKAIDGTVVPLFVDYVNQRILIGTTAVSASAAKVEVVSGDVKIVTAGYGLIVPNRGGTQYYRILMENDGRISADPL